MSSELANVRLALFGFVLTSGVIVLALLMRSKVILDYDSIAPIVSASALIAASALFCRLRGLTKFALIMEVLVCGIVLSVLVLISSYLAISLNYPRADNFLLQLDQWLHFDGPGFIRLVDEIPILSWVLLHAYASFAMQLMVLPMLLIMLKQPEAAFGLILSYGLVGLLASVTSIWFPAVGALVTYGIGPHSLSSIDSHFGYAFLHEFHSVRNNSSFLLSLDRSQGILTFPSVHTAVAILCGVFAFRQSLLRYPLAVLNVLMIVSTLTHGGHYLVDVIAGIVLAAISISIVAYVQGRAGRGWSNSSLGVREQL